MAKMTKNDKRELRDAESELSRAAGAIRKTAQWEARFSEAMESAPQWAIDDWELALARLHATEADLIGRGKGYRDATGQFRPHI